MSDIDARLRMARARTKRTQQEIADESKVSLATIQRAESGKHVPRTVALQRLADALGIKLAWLVTGDGAMLKDDES